MRKLVLIFDYFKEAFHINKRNKALYKPQIALIAVNVLLILLVGIGVYRWIDIENIYAAASMDRQQIFDFILSQGFKLIAIMLAYALISVFIESGILNMYKKAVTQGYTEAGDFKEGLYKYFFKLLLGKILIALCYIISLPFYLALGILTLTVGLAVIPIVAGVFLTMWKVSLVMNNIGIFAAIKDSFSFAKRNFIPLAVLQIIHWAFVEGTRGGGGNFNFNFSGNGYDNGIWQDFSELVRSVGLEEVISVIKIVVAILIPIVAIATIAASIIVMIFEVFFSLALFVAYKNDFKVEEPVEASVEELPENLEDNADNTDVLEEALDTEENNWEVSL